LARRCSISSWARYRSSKRIRLGAAAVTSIDEDAQAVAGNPLCGIQKSPLPSAAESSGCNRRRLLRCTDIQRLLCDVNLDTSDPNPFPSQDAAHVPQGRVPFCRCNWISSPPVAATPLTLYHPTGFIVPPEVSTMAMTTIGALARATGVHVETIHYYERSGLLPEPPRTTTGTGSTHPMLSSDCASSSAISDLVSPWPTSRSS